MRAPTETAKAVIIWTGCGTSTSVHMRQFAKNKILAVIFHVHGHGQVSFDLINPVPKCGIVSHGGFVRRVVLDSAWRPGKPHSRYCPMSTVLRSYQRVLDQTRKPVQARLQELNRSMFVWPGQSSKT